MTNFINSFGLSRATLIWIAQASRAIFDRILARRGLIDLVPSDIDEVNLGNLVHLPIDGGNDDDDILYLQYLYRILFASIDRVFTTLEIFEDDDPENMI